MTINFETQAVYSMDNLDALRGMNTGSVNLIYMDPPFNTGKRQQAPDNSQAAGAFFDDVFRGRDRRESWVADIRQYHPQVHAVCQAIRAGAGDTWWSWAVYLGARLLECSRVLAPNGSIYVHCDPNGNSYLRILMDAIFGRKNFRREIVWTMPPPSGFKCRANNWIRGHDTMLYYARPKHFFEKQYLPYSEEHLARFDQVDEDGNRYWMRSGVKRKLGKGVMLSSCWTDIPSMQTQSVSRKQGTGFPTGKPVEILDRIILSSCRENDVVLDPFCGCGTTMAAAQRQGRRWVGIDKGISESTIRDRLTKITTLFDDERNDMLWVTDPPVRTDGGEFACHRLEQEFKLEAQDAELSAAEKERLRQAMYRACGGTCPGYVLASGEHVACKHEVIGFSIRFFQMDHIVPVDAGGKDRLDNFQLICSACNSDKRARTGLEEE